MNNMPVDPRSENFDHVRNIALDLVLTFVFCGLFNLYVQYCQIQAVNNMIKQEKYSFWPWFFLSLITCGFYHIYHEFRKSTDIALALKDPNSNEPMVSVILTCFGLHIIADAIQQSKINQFYGNTNL